MSNKLGQEPAFPNDNTMDCQPPYCYGMSKRFYAACAAMQGLLAGDHATLQCDKSGDPAFPIHQINKYNFTKIAKNAFRLADELLKQENQ